MRINKEKIITALYLFFAVFMAAIAGVSRSISSYSDLPKGARFTLLTGVLLFGFAVMFYALKYPPKRVWIYASAIFAAIIFLFLPPIASGDAFTSLLRIKMFGLTHVNPYLSAPSQFPGDPWAVGTSWRHIPMPYGPLWIFISAIFVPFIKGSSLTALAAYKLFMSGAAIFGSRLIYKIAESTGGKGVAAEISFLWNPLILLTVFSDAHNDIIMMALFLLAVYLMLNEKYQNSALALTASFLVKYATLAAWPFFLLHIWRRVKKPLALLKALAPSFILIFIVFYPFWRGAETFRGALLAGSIISPNSLIAHTASFFGAKTSFYAMIRPWIIVLTLFSIGAAVYWSAQKEGRIIKGISVSLIILVLSLTDLFNWYLLWPLAILPLISEKKWQTVFFLITIFGIIHIDSPFWRSAIISLIMFGILWAIDRYWRNIRENLLLMFNYIKKSLRH